MEATLPVTKRLKFLDAAKGWGIIMVVFGHITAMGNPVDTWFSSYKLAIFYVVSGYLLSMRGSFQKYSFKTYGIKQVKGLLIPYFGYSGMVLLYHIFIGVMKGRAVPAIFHKFLEQLYATLSGRGVSALWFLPSLFIGQLLFFVVVRAGKLIKLLIVVSAVAITEGAAYLLPLLEDKYSPVKYKIISFPILTVSKGLIAMIFICMGYAGYQIIKGLINRNYRFLLGVLLFAGNIWLSQQNKGIDLNLMRLGENHILFYIGGLAGSFGVILVLEYLEKWWKMTFLNFCGKYSLIIMATHGTLGFKSVAIAGWKSICTLSSEPGLRYYFECSCILGELMLMECGVIQLIEKYMPWLTGRNRGKA